MKTINPNENSLRAQVFHMIPTGRKSSVSMRELSSLLNISDRELRQIVQELRLDGFVICSCQGGYFRPSDNTLDVFRYYKYTRQRARTNIRSLRSTEAYLREKGIIILEDQEVEDDAKL